MKLFKKVNAGIKSSEIMKKYGSQTKPYNHFVAKKCCLYHLIINHLVIDTLFCSFWLNHLLLNQTTIIH